MKGEDKQTHDRFIARLHEQSAEPIYFAPDTSDIAKEIYENCVKVGVPAHLLADIDPLQLAIWIEILRKNAKQQLTEAQNKIGILLYMWHDPQAGQLRYNFIHPDHAALPFTTKLLFAADEYALVKQFLGVLSGAVAPSMDAVMVYQRKLDQKCVFEFQANAKWGPIELGMAMKDVRRALPIYYAPFQRSVEKYSPVDAFDDSAFHVEYDDNDKVRAIEITQDAQIVFAGLGLMGQTEDAVRHHVESKGYSRKPTSEGSYYKDLGLYFNSSGDGIVTNSVVFGKGYYDEIEDIM